MSNSQEHNNITVVLIVNLQHHLQQTMYTRVSAKLEC